MPPCKHAESADRWCGLCQQGLHPNQVGPEDEDGYPHAGGHWQPSMVAGWDEYAKANANVNAKAKIYLRGESRLRTVEDVELPFDKCQPGESLINSWYDDAE